MHTRRHRSSRVGVLLASLLVSAIFSSLAHASPYRLCGGQIALLAKVPAQSRNLNVDQCRNEVSVDFSDCTVVDKDGRRLVVFGGIVIAIDLSAGNMRKEAPLPFGLKFGMTESRARQLASRSGAKNWEVAEPNNPDGRSLILNYPIVDIDVGAPAVALTFKDGRLWKISCDVPEAGP